jgi:hypothetical protein
MPRDIQAGVPQGSIMSPILYSIYIFIYISDMPQTPGVYLGFFPDDTSVYSTDRKEDYALRKSQRGLSATETWCESWNIKINEDNTQTIYFSHILRHSEAILH